MIENDEQKYRQFIKDLSVLDSFHLRKTAEFFNAAAQGPKAAPDFKILATAMEKLADVQDQLAQPNSALLDLLKEHATLSDQIDELLDRSSGAEASRTYARSKIAEFVAAEPEAWSRLAARKDPFTEMAKTYLK